MWSKIKSIDYKKHFMRILYSFLTFLFALLLIIFTAVTNFSNSGNQINLSLILDNWELDPIVDIYVANSSNTCNDTDVSIFSYNWPGTTLGCQCNDGTATTNLCCSEVQGAQACCDGTPILALAGQHLLQWDMSTTPDQQYPYIICGKKLSGYNFRYNAQFTSSCPSGYNSCGSQTNTEYLFCVPTTSKCPIQEVRFEYSALDDDTYEFATLDFPSDTYYVYVKRTDELKQPLVKFRVSNALSACFDESQQYIPVLDFLFDARTNQCQLSTDYTYTDLSSSEEIYFTVNNLSSELTSLPTFQYNSNYPFRLLQQNYYSIQPECKQYIESYYQINNKMNLIQSSAKVGFVLCLIYALEILIIETWIGFRYDKYLWGIIILRQKVHLIWKIIYCLKFLLNIACLISAIIVGYRYNKEYEFFVDQQTNNCFETAFQSQFDNQISSMNPGLITGVIVFLIILFFIEPNVWYVFITCYNPAKYYKETEMKYQIDSQSEKKSVNNLAVIQDQSKQIPPNINNLQQINSIQSTNLNSQSQPNQIILPNVVQLANVPAGAGGLPLINGAKHPHHQHHQHQVSLGYLQANNINNPYSDVQSLQNPNNISQNFQINTNRQLLTQNDINQQNQYLQQQQISSQQQQQDTELIQNIDLEEYQTRPC